MPASARHPHGSGRRPHGSASPQNPVTSAPNRAAASAPDTSYTHYIDPAPAYRQTSAPAAPGRRGHRVTAALPTRSPTRSRQSITTLVGALAASWSHRGGPPLVSARRCGLPRLAPLTLPLWPAPVG